MCVGMNPAALKIAIEEAAKAAGFGATKPFES